MSQKWKEEDIREDGVVKGEAKPVLLAAGLGILILLIIAGDAIIRFLL